MGSQCPLSGRLCLFVLGVGAGLFALVGGNGPKGALTRNQCFSFAWLFGLWGLVERRSRQVELAAYILAHSLTAMWMRMQKANVLNPKKSPMQTVVLGLLLSWLGIAPLVRTEKTSYLGKLFFG